MTLPISPNSIAMSQVNVEIGRPATQLLSLNDADVRTLANKPGSGTLISMNDLRGKSWLTQPMIVEWLSVNRYSVYRISYSNNNSDFQNVNTNSSISSYTGTFNLTAATLPDSRWTTIVCYTTVRPGSSPQITNITFTTTDGSSPTAEPRVQINTSYGIGAAVLRVNVNFKKINTVTVNWANSSNYVSHASILVVPGKWDGQQELASLSTSDADFVSGGLLSQFGRWTPGSFAYNIQTGAANMDQGSIDGNMNPGYVMNKPTGTTAIVNYLYWYASVHFHLMINPTNTYKEFEIARVTKIQTGGGEGETFYSNFAHATRGYRLHTLVSP